MDGRPVIVPGSRADVAAVVALIGRVYDEYGFIWDPATEVPDLLAFDRHYAAPHGAFFVARASGEVVGSVGVEHVDADRAELHRLYLAPAYRGRGTGRALVEAVIAWSRLQRKRRLVLWSDTRFTVAHTLYERIGFSRGGERTIPGDANQSREYGFERLL